MCVCSLGYPTCKAHALYCHLWPTPLCYINMKCSIAGFARSRTVTVTLTSCSYLYLCLSLSLQSRQRGRGTEDTPIINQLYACLRETTSSDKDTVMKRQLEPLSDGIATACNRYWPTDSDNVLGRGTRKACTKCRKATAISIAAERKESLHNGRHRPRYRASNAKNGRERQNTIVSTGCCRKRWWTRVQKSMMMTRQQRSKGILSTMKCSIADFSRSRTVTATLTSCSYLYLCLCSRSSGDGERNTQPEISR